MIIGQGLLLTAIGLLVGSAAAYGLARALAGILFGVSPSDPLAMSTGALVLTITAFVACLIPARRATRVDPARALRYEKQPFVLMVRWFATA